MPGYSCSSRAYKRRFWQGHKGGRSLTGGSRRLGRSCGGMRHVPFLMRTRPFRPAFVAGSGFAWRRFWVRNWWATSMSGILWGGCAADDTPFCIHPCVGYGPSPLACSGPASRGGWAADGRSSSGRRCCGSCCRSARRRCGTWSMSRAARSCSARSASWTWRGLWRSRQRVCTRPRRQPG